MFIDEQDTCLLVEQALPLLPFLDDGNEFVTYALLEQWKEEGRKNPSAGKPWKPEEWSVQLHAPLRDSLVAVGHTQVVAGLRTVAFHDRENGPWGRATAELHEWILAPHDADRAKPSDTAAAAVLLAALYGDDGRFFLPAAPAGHPGAAQEE
ncbi:hypothetical protein OG883_44580 [Streptomyces sp. NBC_01142]|uniref:hypothetical protein n=1 Tax=Streptomyces sp. NBC_01142 TaxID=2975865 RepID=UPI00225923B6|nr:hypothetical protein [Streptomyces sp. NBC_01142]MCX4826722.1 hypothetical protein [Streptomyces sp. NBC_01142]